MKQFENETSMIVEIVEPEMDYDRFLFDLKANNKKRTRDFIFELEKQFIFVCVCFFSSSSL